MHTSRLACFIIDCNTTDLQGAARFWAEALRMKLQPLLAEEGNRYVRLVDPEARVHVEVQAVTFQSAASDLRDRRAAIGQ